VTRNTLVLLTSIATLICGCGGPRVLVLSTGKTWTVANLPCDHLSYSGYSVTVKDIGLPSSVPTGTFTIGEVVISEQKLQDATDRVKELDQIQYRLCQNTNVLIAKSDDDVLIRDYLEASDKTYVTLVDLVRQFDSAKSDQTVAAATDTAVVEIDAAKKRSATLQSPK
jgi:hypothetical protein